MRKLFSYSSWSCLKRCNYQYYCKYVTRKKPTGVVDLTGVLVGKTVHNLVESKLKAFIESDHKDRDSLFSVTRDMIDKELYAMIEKEPHKFLYQGSYKTPVQIGNDALEGLGNTLEMLDSNGYFNGTFLSEHWFGDWKKPLYWEDGLSLQGGIDFVCKLDITKYCVILDYKSSFSFYHLDPDQLLLYAVGTQKTLNMFPTMAGFLLFRYRKIKWIDVSPEAVATLKSQMLKKIAELEEQIEYGKISTNPTEVNCGRCGYSDECKDCFKGKTKKKAIKPDIGRVQESVEF